MLGYIIGSRTPLRMFRRWLLGSMIRNMIILSGIAKEPNWMMSLPNQPRLVFLVVYPLVKYTKLCSLRLEFACRLGTGRTVDSVFFGRFFTTHRTEYKEN